MNLLKHISDEEARSLVLYDGARLADAVFNNACLCADSICCAFNGDVCELTKCWIDMIGFSRFILDVNQFVRQLSFWNEILFGETFDEKDLYIPEDYRELLVLIDRFFQDFMTRITDLIKDMEDKDE